MDKQGLLWLLVLGALSAFLTTNSTAAPAKPYQTQDLRETYEQQRGQEAQSSKIQKQTVLECANSTTQFNNYDQYKSAYGDIVIGVDLRGQIWKASRPNGQTCSIKKLAKIGKPDYTLNDDGSRTWRTYYYEQGQICRYLKYSESPRVSRLCFSPVGIVNRYAPYFTH